jgi:hypothetical protein
MATSSRFKTTSLARLAQAVWFSALKRVALIHLDLPRCVLTSTPMGTFLTTQTTTGKAKAVALV